MTAKPTWLQGRDIGSVVITGQTEDSAGTLSDGTSQTVTGSLVSIEFLTEPVQSNLSPITTTRANQVLEEENNSIRIGVLVNGSGVINPLLTLGATYDVMKVVATRKRSGATTTPTGGTITFFGARGPLTETLDSKGRNVTYLTLTMIDIGSANPTYA